MFDDWEDFFGFVRFMAVILVIGTMIFAAFILCVAIPIDRKSCYASWADYQPTYGLWEGCRIEYHGRRIPTDAVKRVEIAS